MKYKNLDEFYKEYIAKPIKPPTKEEAAERLTKLGVLDKDGNIARDKYKDTETGQEWDLCESCLNNMTNAYKER